MRTTLTRSTASCSRISRSFFTLGERANASTAAATLAIDRWNSATPLMMALKSTDGTASRRRASIVQSHQMCSADLMPRSAAA
jgi:hypothetical protein